MVARIVKKIKNLFGSPQKTRVTLAQDDSRKDIQKVDERLRVRTRELKTALDYLADR